MTKKELNKFFKKYRFLKSQFYFKKMSGNPDDKFCCIYCKSKDKFEVYRYERGNKFNYREFDNEEEAYTYLWELFGGEKSIDFYLQNFKLQ